jgi:hypothetical protein
LIDELDRADEPFEAICSKCFISRSRFPKSTGAGETPPIVVIASNARRFTMRSTPLPATGRLPRRGRACILRRKCPLAPETLARQIVAFTQRLRSLDLFKRPSGRDLDWAEALLALDRVVLDPQTVADTLGVLLKYQDDVGAISPDVAARLVAEARAEDVTP